MSIKISEYASVETPGPTEAWVKLSNESRIAAVESIIQATPNSKDIVEVISTKTDGQVMVRFISPQSSERRGTLLLDLEQQLKQSVDIGVTVWLEPLGDKNSLRNLRGIKVKAL